MSEEKGTAGRAGPTGVDGIDGRDEQTAMKRCQVHEGLRLRCYRCSAGHPTIGYGHKLTPADGDLQLITNERADSLFDQDWGLAIGSVERMCRWRGIKLDYGPRFWVIVEMVFQMGQGAAQRRTGVAGFRAFWRCLKADDFDGAADEMRWSNGRTKARPSKWHLDTPTRCEILARVMRTGTDIAR